MVIIIVRIGGRVFGIHVVIVGISVRFGEQRASGVRQAVQIIVDVAGRFTSYQIGHAADITIFIWQITEGQAQDRVGRVCAACLQAALPPPSRITLGTRNSTPP